MIDYLFFNEKGVLLDNKCLPGPTEARAMARRLAAERKEDGVMIATFNSQVSRPVCGCGAALECRGDLLACPVCVPEAERSL